MIDVFPAQFYYYAGLGCNRHNLKSNRNIGNGIGLFG
jgi:hypothetical protein